MKRIVVCALVMLLSTVTAIPVAQSQTKKKPRRTKTVRPVKPATNSAVTTTPSGLIYIITKQSQGRRPLPGERVAVHYTGLLTSGVKFDSSFDRGQPYEFNLGLGRVIKGWDEGIQKLRVGEQATLVIPPQLGYGADGAGGVIPPGATLIFVVELVAIKGPGD